MWPLWCANENAQGSAPDRPSRRQAIKTTALVWHARGRRAGLQHCRIKHKTAAARQKDKQETQHKTEEWSPRHGGLPHHPATPCPERTRSSIAQEKPEQQGSASRVAGIAGHRATLKTATKHR